MRVRSALLAASLAGVLAAPAHAASDYRKLGAEIDRLMAAGKIPGVAMAVIDHGKVAHVVAKGVRNEKGDPLTPDTIMYAASITKATFAYYVLMLVDDGKVDLDKSIAEYLPKPLPDYPRYADLAVDERWKTITLRRLLTHSSGLADQRFYDPENRFRFNLEPGSRYAYSNEGVNLAQFVIEQSLGLKVGDEMDRRLFKPLGMTRSSMIWRDDFKANLADGQHADGKWETHDDRSSVKAAGSLDTTISDMAKLAAAMVSGWRLSTKARAELDKGSFPIVSQSQFPPFLIKDNPDNARVGLKAGIGVVVFDGPQGRAFYKGGHNDITDNQLVCVEKGKRCVVLLTNSGVGQKVFPPLVKAALGDIGAPWTWEYGEVPSVGP
ncbi:MULTISPECIES: serine hydrolase [unclassified Caulobacter]|uniref:serine hydrolase domain-containing protein n=1 Tax=unclassified Caulobacter TaxID=2648921 RepID=UPI0006F450C4|nr:MULTISPECIES: serine hydrolase domain-containing protein [unclassified Caulobacter]KQV56268.1 serine hydrolase [Caulobacter sp. Root342]KQV70557.1 serine hydrolase [Caulobacter sp. Root343]